MMSDADIDKLGTNILLRTLRTLEGETCSNSTKVTDLRKAAQEGGKSTQA